MIQYLTNIITYFSLNYKILIRFKGTCFSAIIKLYIYFWDDAVFIVDYALSIKEVKE
jgi:hypothetical protein